MHHHSAFQRLGQYKLADKQFLLALALRRSLAFIIEIQTDFPDPCLRMAAQQRFEFGQILFRRFFGKPRVDAQSDADVFRRPQ